MGPARFTFPTAVDVGQDGDNDQLQQAVEVLGLHGLLCAGGALGQVCPQFAEGATHPPRMTRSAGPLSTSGVCRARRVSRLCSNNSPTLAARSKCSSVTVKRLLATFGVFPGHLHTMRFAKPLTCPSMANSCIGHSGPQDSNCNKFQCSDTDLTAPFGTHESCVADARGLPVSLADSAIRRILSGRRPKKNDSLTQRGACAA